MGSVRNRMLRLRMEDLMAHWFRDHKNTILAVIGAAVVVWSLNSSHQASVDAKEAARDALNVQYVQDVRDYNRAQSSCSSSKALRALLMDQLNIAVPKDIDTNPAYTPEQRVQTHQYMERTHAYTDTNPNCKNLPPKPQRPQS